MPSTQSTVDYYCDQLSNVGEIKARKMFGEYGIYCNGVYFGLCCDNKLFFKVKKWPTNEVLSTFGNHNEPYPGAKGCAQVPFEIIENKDELTRLARIALDRL